jgi:putative PIN family toxin of toxin-antitoxin system
MKLVLDTNVFIAALIARGVCSDLLEHCVQQHEIVTSDFILGELRGNLIHKFRYSVQDTEEAVGLLRSGMEVVVPVALESPICRDPDDNTVLGTAIAGNAACIVTGDKDFFVIKRYHAIDIIRPAGFAEYEAEKGTG